MHQASIPIRALILFTLTLFSSTLNAAGRDPGSFFFEDTFGDFKEELQTARDEGKKAVLIFFEMDECPFCHRMKTQVLNQEPVQSYYREHFKIFAVDIEGDLEITDFQGKHTTQKEFSHKQYKVRATPVFAFFDLDGNLIARYTGATSGVEEFMWLGEFVGEGHYKNTNFNKFKREKRRQASR